VGDRGGDNVNKSLTIEDDDEDDDDVDSILVLRDIEIPSKIDGLRIILLDAAEPSIQDWKSMFMLRTDFDLFIQ